MFKRCSKLATPQTKKAIATSTTVGTENFIVVKEEAKMRWNCEDGSSRSARGNSES
jgi:hypothetical protein